jgi:hypothetical protein
MSCTESSVATVQAAPNLMKASYASLSRHFLTRLLSSFFPRFHLHVILVSISLNHPHMHHSTSASLNPPSSTFCSAVIPALPPILSIRAPSHPTFLPFSAWTTNPQVAKKAAANEQPATRQALGVLSQFSPSLHLLLWDSLLLLFKTLHPGLLYPRCSVK